MNERIKELVKKHGVDITIDGMGYGEGNIEGLAELIVQEMLQTCEDHPTWTGRMIGEQIKQHFGVEK